VESLRRVSRAERSDLFWSAAFLARGSSFEMRVSRSLFLSFACSCSVAAWVTRRRASDNQLTAR